MKNCFKETKLLIILFAAVAALIAPVLAGAQEKAKFTIDDVLNPTKFTHSAPSGFIWLPGGREFLYFLKEGDANNLYRFECATGMKEKIADWDEIERGLEAQRAGREEPPMGDVNSTGVAAFRGPTISADGSVLLDSIKDDLFLFEIATGKAHFITDNPDEEIFPLLSPDGSKVAFARKGDLYTVDVASGAEKRLTTRPGSNILNGVADWVYEEELGVRQSFWWAPDSRRIAFMQFDTSPIPPFPITDDLVSPVSGLELQMYPKAGEPNSIVRLGVIDTQTGKAGWINTGVESDFYIPSAGWLPDGSKLWYTWLNRDQTRLELRFACPVSGNFRTVVVDEDPAWVGMRVDKLTWVDAGRFIWAAEWDGWQHLYLFDTEGKRLGQITKGEWEVDNVYGFGTDKKSVIFQATEVSPLERHIYRVDLDGGGFKKLTTEEGIHGADMAAAGPYFIKTFSGPSTPPRIEICNLDGKSLYLLDDGRIPSLDSYALAQPEYFTVTAEDGAVLQAMMIKPPDFDPAKKYSVLVLIYGGPESQAVTKGWQNRGMFNQLLAQEGIILFRIDNRGTAARGRDWSRIVYRNLGYWEVRDHVEGVKYLKTLPYVDPARIGIYGGSYGGYMTLMAMLKAPEHFNVGVSAFPVTDWRLYDTIYTERYMDTPADNPEGYRVSAPLNFAENLKGKLLLYHGEMDNNVHMQNTILMIEELVKAGKQFELMIYPRERHGIRSGHRREHQYRMIYDFLIRELKGNN
jgi:dipeptidyl-peptidase-4